MTELRICLPFADWPAADRAAWDGILAEGDLATLRERAGIAEAGLEEVFIRLLEQQEA